MNTIRRLKAWMLGTGFAAAALALPLIAAAQTLPEDVHEHGPGQIHFELTDVLLGAFVNFGLLVALLVWAGRKKVLPYLAARRKQVEDGMAEAARLTAQAQAAHDEYSRKLASLNDELEKIRSELRASGEEDKRRLLEDAEARAARMKQDAELLIEQQLAELRATVTREVVDAAVQAAREALQGEMKPADQERLAQAYLAQLRETLGAEAQAQSPAKPALRHQEHA